MQFLIKFFSTQKFEISLRDRFVLHRYICHIGDKYEVCVLSLVIIMSLSSNGHCPLDSGTHESKDHFSLYTFKSVYINIYSLGTSCVFFFVCVITV